MNVDIGVPLGNRGRRIRGSQLLTLMLQSIFRLESRFYHGRCLNVIDGRVIIPGKPREIGLAGSNRFLLKARPISRQVTSDSRSLDLSIHLTFISLVISLRSPRRANPPRAGLARSSSFLTLLAPSRYCSFGPDFAKFRRLCTSRRYKSLKAYAKRVRNISMKSRVET
jgi:hypothetical protein